MHKNSLAKKGLALATIVLFIGMSAIPVAGDIETEKYADAGHTSLDFYGVLNNEEECYPCYPVFLGLEGKNGWFIADVLIQFYYDPVRVVKIWYQITRTRDWIKYEWEPFSFTDEGEFSFEWKWEDPFGNISFPMVPGSLKIDKTPPTIELNKKVGLFNKKKITFTANVDDGESGIERVEFYLDGELQENLTEPPYQYVYEKGGKIQEVEAIVYDIAGHSNSDKSDTEPASYPALFMSKILQRIHAISQLFLKLIKIIVPSY